MYVDNNIIMCNTDMYNAEKCSPSDLQEVKWNKLPQIKC